MSAFGVPITAESVEAIPRYIGKGEITQEDCARVAMDWIHADGKNMKALKHALDLKSGLGVGGGSAMVLVYNATGDTLDLVDQKDWDGSGVYHETPPASFKNGQWIAFLHHSPIGSMEGARVYRGDIGGGVRDYMIAWSVPWDSDPNCAYTEVRNKDHFKSHWDYIKKSRLRAEGKVCRDETDQYCASTISVGGYLTSECIAVLRRKFSPLPEKE